MVSDETKEDLARRLRQVEEELRRTEDAARRLTRERDALKVLVGEDAGAPPTSTPGVAPVERPKIREVAVEYAREHGKVVVIRDVLKITRSLGFRIDAGGLHTYLKGLKEFEHIAPGQFRYLAD